MASQRNRSCTDGCPAFSALLRLWKRCQVSYYGGKYSVERLFAFEAYIKSNSLPRVLLICIGTPIPMIALVILQEVLPLQDPTFGWCENYTFWIRAAILAFVVAQSIAGQARYIIDGVTISEWHLAIVSACASIIFTICAMIVSANLIFPVPFFVLTLAPMFYVILIISFRIIVGGRIWCEMLTHSDQLIRYIVFVCAQVTVAFVYPIYESLFHFVEGTRYQFAVILLLPVIKVGVKNMMLRCTKHMEDMIPEAVIFTVDFFNAIYVATCMQSASSVIAVTAISVTDLVQASVMLYGLHRRTATIRPKLNHILHSSMDDGNIVIMAGLLCRDFEKFKKQSHVDIHLRSCIPHVVDSEDKEILNTFESKVNGTQSLTKPPSGSVHGSSKHHKPRALWAGTEANVIHPILPTTNNITNGPSQIVPTAKSTALRETLEMFFTSECIIVTGYLEAVVPLFYCGYILMMVHLPSALYHTEMTGITRDNVGGTVLPLFIFALLQVASFILLALVIKRNCGMRALYQLAFVLETQMSLIQGKMMLWMVITICFRVVHFGKWRRYRINLVVVIPYEFALFTCRYGLHFSV
ncbi:hypothetical protein PHMEG_0003599 [Phytophthora megakarya]|uniref:Transmembrane protein n=1 Tax=Phytophthora megakarya TaxID=4795 RepID=A0A225WVZ2_9STRA|nr:hypothetical protein PHMEG_0003599 [Phytophthora megakarya]